MTPADRSLIKDRFQPGRSTFRGFSHPVSFGASGLLVTLLAYILIWSPNFNAPLVGGDYMQFYMAARIVRDGMANRLYDFPFQLEFQRDPARMPFEPQNNVSAIYVYPPFFVWFCLPFSWLSFRTGASAWVLFMAGALVAGLRLLVHEATRNRDAFGFALLASVPFLPSLMSIYSCQNATLSLLILAATYVLLRGGRPMTAGTIFAMQAFKPQLIVVIACAMLYKKQWRFGLGNVIGGGLLLMASLAVSPVAMADYLRLGPTLSRWIDMPGMHLAEMACWQGFWRLLLADQPLAYAQAAALASSLLTLIPVLRSLQGPLDTLSARFASQFSVLVLATIVISPHLLYYDLTLLLIPMILAAGWRSVAMGNRTNDIVWPSSTAILFAGATVSRVVAAETRIQVIVPMIVIYMFVLTETRCKRLALSSTGPPKTQDRALESRASHD